MFIRNTLCSSFILCVILSFLFSSTFYGAVYSQSILPDITSKNSNNNVLLVSIFPQKNPIARGDSQNIIITVTDSNSKAVPDAHIDGKLSYPGGNYEKDFSGITDTNGKFEYSLTIGKNGDVGELSVNVDASSPAYGSAILSRW